MVAVELKIGKYKEKMKFYLNILNDKIRLPHENPSISLTTELPESYQKLLPDGDEIAKKLNLLMDK